MAFGENGKYEPNGIPVRYNEYDREFEKTFYIKDIRQRLQRVLELEVERPNSYKDNKKKVPTKNDYSRGMFFGEIYSATRRHLQIDVKVLDIIEQAQRAANADTEKEISMLINARYTRYENLFMYDWENMAYADEYNYYIADKLQERIRELAAPATEAFEAANANTLPKLKWNISKNVLGTLFGVLLEKGAISGSATALNEFIRGAFDGFSKESLDEQLRLKTHKNKGAKYNKDVLALLSEFSEYIEDSLKPVKK